MDNYKYAVEYLARNNIDTEFDNKGADHAAAVLSSMLNNTQHTFKIFSGELNSEVSKDDSFLKALNIYLQSGKQFEIILEDMPDEKSHALKQVLDASKSSVNNVKYKRATDIFLSNLQTILNNPYHFAVSDHKAYRIEVDKKEYKAICNFNDPKIANKLEKVFDDFFLA